MRPGLDKVLNSSIYGQIYGYLPGIAQSHGIRLSAIAQWGFGGLLPDPYASVTPRGLNTSPDACNFLYKYFPAQAKFSIDYAMPVLPVNWDGLGPVAYVRNFELIPHADFAYMGKSSRFDDGTLMSLGGSLSVRLGNFLWIPYTTRIGVDYSYNCGSLISTLDTCGSAPRKHSVSLMMSVDF